MRMLIANVLVVDHASGASNTLRPSFYRAILSLPARPRNQAGPSSLVSLFCAHSQNRFFAAFKNIFSIFIIGFSKSSRAHALSQAIVAICIRARENS